MRTNARANQGGSIVSFIVIGTILLVGLGGSAYYLSQRDGGTESQVGQVSEDDTTQEAAPQENDESSEDSAVLDEPSETPAPAQDDADSAPEEIATTGGPAPTEELPQTGPADMTLSVLALAAVSFGSVAFYRSRRQLQRELG